MSATDRNAPPAIINLTGRLIRVGPNQVRVLAGIETGDPIGAVEYSIAPGFAPPPVLHRHTREDAGWFVLEGALALTFENDQTVVAGPGDSVTHPRGCWFRWGNANADEAARAICWFAPAGFEQIFADIAAAADDHVAGGGSMDDFLPTLLAIRARYGDELYPGTAS